MPSQPDVGATISPQEAAKLHSEDVVSNLPAPENKKFYPALDGLRAVAVLMVFYNHYLVGKYPALNWGWAGVDIFFVLSGFLITGILYDTRNSAHRFRNFYIRRTLRIFPLYYGVLLGALLLTPIFHWVWHPAWILWSLYLGNYARFLWLNDYLQGARGLEHLRSSLPFHHPFLLYLGHFWSLCVEEQFYLVWPLVVFLIRDRVRLRNLCLLVCVLCLFARVLCVFFLPRAYLDADILFRATPFRADALLFGAILALMLRGPEGEKLKILLRPTLVLFASGFLLFEVLHHHAYRHFYYPVSSSRIFNTIGYTLLDFFCGLIVLLCLNSGGIFYRVLTLKPLRRLGQVSYGFYVFHDIPHVAYSFLFAHTFARYTNHEGAFVALFAFVGTLALSFLSFRFFEAPFLRLKQRYAPN